jgi:hypothetical protein
LRLNEDFWKEGKPAKLPEKSMENGQPLPEPGTDYKNYKKNS